MFAGGAAGVDAVGLLVPPPHAVSDPIAVAIASHFVIVPPNELSIWNS
jgi:hypothetical protein